MRLSTRDQSEFETVRMEDVVFTLNNIVDDISRMYAGSFDDESLDDSPMEIDVKQLGSVENKSQQEINPSARPDSPTLSEPPTSARSTASSDSEDTLSLYSASLGSSPVSSGFTTPSSSPTSLTFITDKDTTDWDPVSIHPLVGVDGNLPHVSSNVQIETWTLLKPMAGIDTVSTGMSETYPSDVAPISILEVPVIKLEPSSNPGRFSWMPSLAIDSDSLIITGSDYSPSLEQGGIEIIYQTSASPPVFLATPSDPMPSACPPHPTMAPPRLPPRPTHPRDSPPHLLALRLPTSLPTPRLDQNEEWDTGSQMKRNELGAAHLVQQRQWARMTIMYASSLAEPQDLASCRPVDKYLEWGSYSSSLVSPPRKRILGATGRRVHIGPKTLPRGDWDPERRGGAIDRWNNRETLRRERTRAYENAEQGSRRKLKPIVPLWINTSSDYRKDSGTECEKAAGEGDAPVSPPYETGSTQGNEEMQQERGTAERNQDTMRLCVKDGKRVLSSTRISAPNSDSGSQSQSESSGSVATASTPSPPVDGDPNTMRWCVKNGVRVSSQAGNPTPDSNSKLETSTSIGAQKPAAGGTPVIPGNCQNTSPLDQKRPDAERPYIPKKRSPLSRTLLPVSSATMRFQLRPPGDVLGVGKTRRKFASMMF